MGIRIASVILSVAGLLALILGLVGWAGISSNLLQMHMLLGFLTVGALSVIGIGQAVVKGGSWLLALVAVAVGALTATVGMVHGSLLEGELHWMIQAVHLILGLGTIGIGHMAAARYRRARS